MLIEAASVPAILKITASPSASDALTAPMAVWFSAALKVANEVKAGELSLRFVTLIVISCVVEFVPSVAVTVAV